MDYSDIRQNDRRMKRYYKSKLKKAKNKAAVIVIRVTLILIAVAVFGGGSMLLGAYNNIVERAPRLDDILLMVSGDNNFSTVIIDEMTGEVIDQLDGGETRKYAESSEIPDHMKQAMIAIEDERFYQHDGIDLRSMFRSVWYTLFMGQTQGGSTITQQVIKNRLGYLRNSFESKFQEQQLAMELEERMTLNLGSKEAAKDYILTLYLNSAGLGHGTVGVQAAANYYFNKDVMELTLSECATIAAITSNPVARDPLRRPEWNRPRRKACLDKMLELSFITQAEYDEAINDDVYSRVQAVVEIETTSSHSYFVDYMLMQIKEDLMAQRGVSEEEANDMIYRQGLRIYPTMDPRIQQIVDEAYTTREFFPKEEYEVTVEYRANIKNSYTGLTRSYNNMSNLGIVKSLEDVDDYVANLQSKILKDGDEIVEDYVYPVEQPQSGFALIDHHTGHVVAIAGARGEKQSNKGLNRATGIVRQPGSTFKVLASFAPAVDLGIATAATVYDDVPRYNNDGTLYPRNWYNAYRGLKTVREGVTQSMNIMAVKNLERVGVETSVNYLLNFGITSLVTDMTNPMNDYNLSTGLGGITNGVSPLELAAAYGTIANEGVYIRPVFYKKVLAYDGRVLLDSSAVDTQRQVLKKTSAFIVTDMLRTAMISPGTGDDAAFTNVKGIQTAGKTGTTTGTKDLFFAGYTPYYTAAVWLGHDMPKNLTRATSNEKIHLKMWKYIMEEVHKPLEPQDFTRPEGIVQAQFCKSSGKIPVPGLCDHDPRGSQIGTEYFEIGTEPSEPCDVHVEYTVCVLDHNNGGPYRLPTELCPADHIATLVGIVRPEPYYGDAAIGDGGIEVPAEVLNGEFCIGHRYPQQQTYPQNPTDVIPEGLPQVLPGGMPDGLPQGLTVPDASNQTQTDPPLMEQDDGWMEIMDPLEEAPENNPYNFTGQNSAPIMP